MLSVVALSMAVSLLYWGGVQAMSAGYRGPGYYPEDLKNLQDSISRVSNEFQFMVDRLTMTQSQKEQVDVIYIDVTAAFTLMTDKNTEQYGRINSIKDTLKSFYHRVGAVEARLAAMVKTGDRLKKRLPFLQQQVDAFRQHSHVKQDAALDEIQSIAAQAQAKVNDKLDINQAEREDQVGAIQFDINQSVLYFRPRTCFQTIEEVEIDAESGEGTEEAQIPDGFFVNRVPTVLCGLQGVVSEADPDHSTDYRGYDDRQRLGVTVDCKAFGNKITIKAFDKSASSPSYGHDGKTRTVYAYVEVRACAYGNQGYTL